MSRDEIIRIILEVKDRGSGAVKNFEKNTNNSIGNIRSDLSRLDKDNEQYSKNWRRQLASEEGSVKIWSKTIEDKMRRVQNALSRTRSEFEKTNISFGKTERGGNAANTGQFSSVAQRRDNNQVRNPAVVATQTAFNSFRQGINEAKELETMLKERYADNEKQLKEQKENFKQEKVERNEILKTRENILREVLRHQQEDEKKALEKGIREKKAAVATEQDLVDQRVTKRERKRKLEFDLEQDARQDILRKETYERKQKAADAIYARNQQFKDSVQELRSGGFKGDRLKAETDILRKAKDDDLRVIRKERDNDIKIKEAANTEENRANSAALKSRIALLRDANASVRRENAKALATEIRERNAAATDISEKDRRNLSASIRDAKSTLGQELRDKASQLTGAGEADLVKTFIETRKAEQALSGNTNVLSRSFKTAGNSFGDLMRGFKRGRSDLREIDKLTRAADTGFARFGQTLGKLTKNFGSLVNIRWYLVISAVQILGQLVLVLAANLISLASSAALAAAALGAGLVAAVSQAIPVVGLLYAAFSRVTAAFSAAQQASKANATSSQDAKAQAEAQTAAQQRLTDALYSQTQAVQQLADARKQAKRDIVDSLNAEIDANYSLKDAEFAVLDAKEQLRQLELQNKQSNQSVKDAQAQVNEAKQRLAIAKKEGDQAEISKGAQQLAVAQQNLASAQGQTQNQKVRKRQIDEQKLAVKEAEQQAKEAKISQKRQVQDTARTVKLGVKGNQQVVAALHGVTQANREVANAQRGVSDAMTKQASAGNLLQRQLSQLDPTEKALYKTFVSLRSTFKKQFRPVTDIIVEAVNGAVKRIIKLLKDPQFIHAFSGLAQAIGKGLTELSKFFTSKGFIHSFEGFIHAAIQNVPILVKIIENLAKAFVGVAKAGQPVVKDLLGRFESITKRFSDAVNAPAGGTTHSGRGTGIRTTQQTKGQDFVSKAKTYLDSWIKLADAIGRVFRYLITDSAPAGKGLLGSLTHALNNLADFLKDNPQKVNKFFTGMARSLEQLSGVLFPLVKILLSAFTGNNATQFTEFTAQVVIPGIAILIKFLGILAKVALFLIHLPGIGGFAKIALEIIVAEKALNKIFPVTQKATDALKNMGGWFFKVGEDGTRGITKIRGGFTRFIQFTRTTVIPAISKMVGTFAKGVASMASDAANASKKAILWLGRTAYAMAETVVNAVKKMAVAIYEVAVKAFVALVAFITETLIPTLITLGEAMWASLGPWGLIIGAIILAIALLDRKFHFLAPTIKFIGKIFKDVFDWIKDHWKLLLVILTGPLGLAIYAFIHWKDKIIGFFKGILGWIEGWGGKLVKWFESLPGKIGHALAKLPDIILHLFEGLGKKIFKELFSFLPKSVQDALGKVAGFAGNIANKAKDFGSKLVPGFLKDSGGIIGDSGRRSDGPHGTDTVKAWLTPGEWILNKTQQAKLARRLQTTTQQTSAYLFGTNQGHGKPSKSHGGIHHPKHISSHKYGAYNLVSQTDQDGNVVWFIELDDGSYAGVTGRDALHIQKSHGSWIPKYIRRDSHGFTQSGQKALKRAGKYAMGGVVMPDYRYSMGGVINSPQNSYGGSSTSWNKNGGVHHKKIEQNFQVSTQGETDWNYIMRLAAMHAQGSF